MLNNDSIRVIQERNPLGETRVTASIQLKSIQFVYNREIGAIDDAVRYARLDIFREVYGDIVIALERLRSDICHAIDCEGPMSIQQSSAIDKRICDLIAKMKAIV